MNWYLTVLKKYAVFKGRARRKEYWMFVLFNIIFSIVAMLLDNLLGTAFEGIGYGLIYILYVLAVLIPGLAVTVRRLHDTGRNGWWILISLVPMIGAIWLLVLLIEDSQPGENQYGPNPKGVTENLANQHEQKKKPALITAFIGLILLILSIVLDTIEINPTTQFEVIFSGLLSSLTFLAAIILFIVAIIQAIRNHKLKKELKDY